LSPITRFVTHFSSLLLHNSGFQDFRISGFWGFRVAQM